MNQSVIAKEEKLFIPGPVGKIEALLRGVNVAQLQASELKTPIGVICHPHPLHQGTMQNKVVTTIAKAWQEMNLATLRFNFRGVGESEGEYAHGKGEIEDLEAVLNWLLKSKPNTRFWLGGFSFGAFITIEVAAEQKYPVDALLSVAPPLRFFTHTQEKLPRSPWYIIHGEQDELVPHAEVLAWYDQIKQKKKEVELISFKDTTHFFHGKLTELKQTIIKTMGSGLNS